MSRANKYGAVSCIEREIVIPTYPVQDADPNPMFLEKRVYQGSSGKVYPNPFTDRVALGRVDKSYRAIVLENEYIQLMILPQIGGRIFTGLDKTNQYDFFYRQHVIKPALVGCWGRGSQVASNLTGHSTTAPPHICLFTQALRSTRTAAARFG